VAAKRNIPEYQREIFKLSGSVLANAEDSTKAPVELPRGRISAAIVDETPMA